MLAGEILLMTHIVPRNVNGTFPFYEAYHLRYCILGWYGDQHMNMVGSQMSLQDLTFFLACEVPER